MGSGFVFFNPIIFSLIITTLKFPKMNKIKALLLLAIVALTVFAGCKKDGDTDNNKNLVVTIVPDPDRPLATKDCVECHESTPSCLGEQFGKANVRVFDNIAGSEIINREILTGQEVNLGELNPGTYEIWASYLYDYQDTTHVPANPWGPAFDVYFDCHGILHHGERANDWGSNFQILEGSGKKLTISSWTE